MALVASTSIDDVVHNLCQRLRCSVFANDLQRLNHARDNLNKLQLMSAFENALPGGENMLKDMFLNEQEEDSSSLNSMNMTHLEPIAEEFEEICEEMYSDSLEQKDTMEDNWQGYFSGFRIVQDFDQYSLHDERKCVQLGISQCSEEIEFFIRNGVRCFLIDLFIGTNSENQASIVRLRQSELKVSKEFGFPVRTTLVASLSPRLQYIGQLVSSDGEVELQTGDHITLSTDRKWSAHGTQNFMYVNARFLLPDVKNCDALFIGCDIQIVVRDVNPDRLYCIVIHGGKLRSRLPVLFPARCNKFRISLEELEDITFCKEVGINAIVSYTHGTEEYLKDMQECMGLLHCANMRLGARVSINDIKGCDEDFSWIANSYDLFIFDILPPKKSDRSEILHLCPAGEKFMKKVYDLKKPILFDAFELANKHYIADPDHYMLIFHNPDRYIIKCDALEPTSYIFSLQSVVFDYLPQQELSQQPYCDKSLTGSDSLARACATASIEMKAPLILVCSMTGRMAQKISHFRPKAHILFISCMASAADFLSMYWNITVLYFRLMHAESHRSSIFKHLLFGLLYAKSRKLLSHNDKVIFVFGREPGLKFSDEYHVFRYDQVHFVDHLSKVFLEK